MYSNNVSRQKNRFELGYFLVTKGGFGIRLFNTANLQYLCLIVCYHLVMLGEQIIHSFALYAYLTPFRLFWTDAAPGRPVIEMARIQVTTLFFPYCSNFSASTFIFSNHYYQQNIIFFLFLDDILISFAISIAVSTLNPKH